MRQKRVSTFADMANGIFIHLYEIDGNSIALLFSDGTDHYLLDQPLIGDPVFRPADDPTVKTPGYERAILRDTDLLAAMMDEFKRFLVRQ